MPPPHIALRGAECGEEDEGKTRGRGPPSPPLSPDYPVYGGYYSNASYMLDGVMLSERGMQHLKSLTIEKDKIRRKRRMGEMGMDPMGGSSHDNSLEGDDDDDDDPPIIVAGSSGHKDGEIVRPLPDGSAPDPPEGFTIVVKDNGLMVLRKRRYRDLKKVGIGGFLAKTRTPKQMTKKEGDPEEEKPKKRPAWRPKKNKILVQYPEYIQDSFFGREFIQMCPDKVDEDEELPEVEESKLAKQDDGKTILLNRDALAALEELKAKEEAERKLKEEENAKERAAAEAAAKESAEKVRIAQEQYDALNKKETTDDKDKKEKKGDEKMEEDDLPNDMLPSDLFGDDIFKCLTGGTGDIVDIDDSALDEEDTNENNEPDSADNNELAAGLRDMLGPEFNAKDMEDIFKGIVDTDENKETKKEPDDKPKESSDIKQEELVQEQSTPEVEAST